MSSRFIFSLVLFGSLSACGGGGDPVINDQGINANTTNNSVASVINSMRTLNDTGITKCFDHDKRLTDYPYVECSEIDLLDQDAQKGRDVQSSTNNSIDGRKGFSFEKRGSSGHSLIVQNAQWDDKGSENAGSKWSCVEDKVTGLIWEVKLADTSLRGARKSCHWYSDNNSTNGGSTGIDSHALNSSYCTTQSYINHINSIGLCGFSDWRLPMREELRSLVDYGAIVDHGRLYSSFPPLIDSHYFPNNRSSTYWSYTSAAASYPTAIYSTIKKAWVVDFKDGREKMEGKFSLNHLRLVRNSN